MENVKQTFRSLHLHGDTTILHYFHLSSVLRCCCVSWRVREVLHHLIHVDWKRKASQTSTVKK
jgi:hypothetical protein